MPDNLSPFRFPDGSLKPIAGGAPDDPAPGAGGDPAGGDPAAAAPPASADPPASDPEAASGDPPAADPAAASDPNAAPPASSDPDPFDEAIKAKLEEMRPQWEQEYLEKLQADRQNREAEQTWDTTTGKVVEALKGVQFKGKDANGADVTFTLTQEQIDNALKPLGDMRGGWRQQEEAAVFGDLATTATALLPKEGIEAFNKAAGGKDIGEWLKVLIEHAAPQTKAFEAAKKTEYARGWDARGRAPGGQPSQQGGGGSGSGGSGTYKSLDELTQAKAAGQFKGSDSEFIAEQDRLLAGK